MTHKNSYAFLVRFDRDFDQLIPSLDSFMELPFSGLDETACNVALSIMESSGTDSFLGDLSGIVARARMCDEIENRVFSVTVDEKIDRDMMSAIIKQKHADGTLRKFLNECGFKI